MHPKDKVSVFPKESSFLGIFGIDIEWVKVFKNEPSKICGRQTLENLKCYGVPKQTFKK